MKKVWILSLVLLMCGAMAFARGSQQPSTGQSPAGNELIISYGMEPNLDPHWNAGTPGARIMQMLYEGLYRYNETSFELAGAESVEVSADGLTWTFRLRRESKWSDGKPVTAANYVYSMKRLVNPEIGTTYMKDYGQFLKNGLKIAEGQLPLSELGVRAIDDYTLEIKLENVCSFFDAILCYTTFYPLREEFVREDGTGDWAWEVNRMVTNGAMKLVSCNEMEEIVLEKSETYWDKANIALDRLVIKLLDDNNTRLALFNTNQIDMIFDFPSEEVIALNRQGYYHTAPRLMSGFLLINNNKAPLNDPRVRRALALGFDRKYLCEVLLNNTKIPATTFIGKGFPGSVSGRDFYSESPEMVSFNPDEARRLLAEAGFPGGRGLPVLEISYASNPDYNTLFEYLQSVWKQELGVETTLTSMEPAAMTALRDEGKFDITPQNWGADYFDVSNMLSIFAPGNLINAGRYNNPVFSAAYTRSLQTINNAERINLLHDAERLIIQEDSGIIPLYYWVAPYIFRNSVVTNVIYDSNGTAMFTKVIVKK
ncbi:MAG: peptide ABC transporter substrate-binding protein [Treponema sp.]|nr:peptide ABC transporter substrate-binding protein [Treponema sp.]